MNSELFAELPEQCRELVARVTYPTVYYNVERSEILFIIDVESFNI